MRDPARRVFWPQLALLFVTLVLCELVISVASSTSPRIRYYLSPPWDRAALPDPVLGRRMSPFYPGHDRLGFRNKNVPDQVDVLAVGDSLTYGYAAPPEGSWPFHLQQLSGRTVYNAGVGGYGPLEYGATIEELSKLRPTTVLMGLYLGNDLLNTYVSVYTDRRFPQFTTRDAAVRDAIAAAEAEVVSDLTRRQFRSPDANRADEQSQVDQIASRSSLYSLTRNLYLWLRGDVYQWPFPSPINPAAHTFEAAAHRPGRVPYDAEPEFRTVFREPGFLRVAVDDADPRVREGGRIAREELLNIRDRLRARNVRLIVVLLPYKPAAYASRRRDADLPETLYDLGRLEQRHVDEFRQYLADNGIEVADATSAMERAFARHQQPYLETEDDHPNSIGYHAVAEAILPMLSAGARTSR